MAQGKLWGLTQDPTNPPLLPLHPVRSPSPASEASTALSPAKGYPANTFKPVGVRFSLPSDSWYLTGKGDPIALLQR